MGRYETVCGCGGTLTKDYADIYERAGRPGCVASRAPCPALSDATDEQIAAEQERREREWTDEGWAEWRRGVDEDVRLLIRRMDRVEYREVPGARAYADGLVVGAEHRFGEKVSGRTKDIVSLYVIAFVLFCGLLLVFLTGCATHTQPDTSMWDEAREQIRTGKFTDDDDPMVRDRRWFDEHLSDSEPTPSWRRLPPPWPGAIDVTGTPVWDADNGVWRQGGPCLEQPIRHADDAGVWG